MQRYSKNYVYSSHSWRPILTLLTYWIFDPAVPQGGGKFWPHWKRHLEGTEIIIWIKTKEVICRDCPYGWNAIISKQEIEVVLLFPNLGPTIYFPFLPQSPTNKKWNCLNRKWNYCHTRSQLGIQLVWILQVLTCKLGPEGLVYVRVHRPAGRPPTRCYIGFSYFLTSNQKTSFTKSF